MRTIKGIKAPGVPWGTRWANICWVWLIHPKSIKLIHSGNESDKVIDKWDVEVKMYGISPKKLLNKIKENKEVKRTVVFIWEGVNKALNSVWMASMILFQSKAHREGISQYLKGINNKPKNVESQLRERVVSDEEGSKTENKFAIIFKSKKSYVKA